VEAELGAEVGHQVLVRVEQQLQVAARVLAVVGVVARHDPVVVVHEHPVFGRGVEPRLRDAAQEHLGVVVARLPELGVEPVEETAHRAVPAVEQVVGELLEARDALRKRGLNLECETGAWHGVVLVLGQGGRGACCGSWRWCDPARSAAGCRAPPSAWARPATAARRRARSAGRCSCCCPGLRRRYRSAAARPWPGRCPAHGSPRRRWGDRAAARPAPHPPAAAVQEGSLAAGRGFSASWVPGTVEVRHPCVMRQLPVAGQSPAP
jgi:hypothetical protein